MAAGNDFYDRVELTGSRTFSTTARPGNDGTYVIGSGTQADPWQMYNNNIIATDNNDASGNVAVTYAGSGRRRSR